MFFFLTGHYYGTPRPTKETIIANNIGVRRSNSADKMFQPNDLEVRHNQNFNTTNIAEHLNGQMIECTLRKGQKGFGFTIIEGYQVGERFLQIKEIASDGPAARNGQLQRGDILVYINNGINK